MPEVRGQLIARQYRLVEEIGRGGFGVVWRARDERLHRDVAAKELFLPSYLAADQRQERRERSLREARSAARIVHSAAVTVYDVVEHEGCPWIIMELIHGRALNNIVKTQGPLPPKRAAEIGLAVLQALQAAHAAGVVHRDVKPGNVLINEHRVVLTDFGIATIEGDPSLTHSGFVMGAPAYTAPERARGESAVPASDLWSLGASLFYAVEGRRPYPGGNANAVFHAILNEDPPLPRRAGPLTPIIRGLLRKEITERLTAGQAAALLEEIIEDPRESTPTEPSAPYDVVRSGPTHASPLRRRAARSVIGIAAAFLIAVALAGTYLWPDSPSRTANTNLRAAQSVEARRPVVLPGTRDKVYAVAFSPSGRLVAAAGEDGAVRLWSAGDHRLVSTLQGHTHAVFTMAFSPDGQTLATGGYDKQVILWDVASRTRLTRLNPDQGTITALTFSPDGRTLVSAGTDDVQLWSVADRRRVKTLGGSGETEFTAAYNRRDGLAVASTDTLRLWRGGRSHTIAHMTTLIRAMAFSPDGRTVACGGDNGRVALWDVVARKRLGILPHDKGVYAVAFSPNGRSLASASGQSITIWNVATRTRVTTLTGHQDLVSSLAFSPDGRTLATGAYDNTVRLWRTPLS